MNRKWPTISILDLYATSDTQKWNEFLSTCLKSHNVALLKQTLYGIQAGMTDVSESGVVMDSIKLKSFFVRLQRSIEQTAKQIFREKYPNPCDDPLNTNIFKEYVEAKRKRDVEFEYFLRMESF